MLSSLQLRRGARVFFVRNVLQKSHIICLVTRQEPIHAVAYFPARGYSKLHFSLKLESDINGSKCLLDTDRGQLKCGKSDNVLIYNQST